ncbi:uncharacterized protein Z518_00741 [Rhinocladiella mackenziei CBS 650.93]|uniref:Queuine tRNA-ribosyltransferase accessory subunit 2 n=1 Tax=Rhinocladiella mackenziei CBS 650.93 TaxID=1442369 RepID=A0A0D2JJN4_9EURO|nr:uncharacterized protein Z518_00741 [Rhinocladiella mackenziei CBS 650.93]KIX09660.1 hypothetical protein Z518_00741 [Rhinocladiella mackenziei CBS 650.93]
MEHMNGTSLPQLPEEMLKFVLQHAAASETSARLGQLTFRGRPPISTPYYIVPTSRGVVPHLSQDNLQKHTGISAVFVPLEDFIEKSHANAPIYNTPVENGGSPLRRYIGLPDRCLSILGPRRVPSIPCPAHNTNSSIAISTSVGFGFLEAEQYHEAIRTLKADISTSLADLIATETASVKRFEKSADRTHAWLRDSIEARGAQTSSPFFASVPPLEPERLSLYFSDLQDEYKSRISGLCIYLPSSVAELPQSLRQTPTMCLSDPLTPQALLVAIHQGVDLMTVPFVTRSSEHGIALSFLFPGSSDTQTKPLGTDLWSTTHATDLSPLSPDCTCYSCTRHHRAYVHHLLQANEMLAWTLLQIHNYTVIESFFHSVRQSIARGTFKEDINTFGRTYEFEIPKQTGQGPRVRGYQMKSVGGGEPKKNPKVYGKLDDQVQKLAEAESGIATPDGSAEDVEAHGWAQKLE